MIRLAKMKHIRVVVLSEANTEYGLLYTGADTLCTVDLRYLEL